LKGEKQEGTEPLYVKLLEHSRFLEWFISWIMMNGGEGHGEIKANI